ncbi:MAG: tRNA (adenosine(37)-N6)-threonylcarbamoyltransferase complex dimerization subunit type 1 TsaB [Bacteroidales bacterium]|nr:tRNA (adenosine(37)-N6)-threonylcarbamoyltransferase complex dimerization subunit type 1 TsaB [Bacteroidales bacterium]
MASRKSRIILIETSASLCSVALAEDGVVLAVRESAGGREHAALTAPFVSEVLAELGLKVADCAAVCLSAGPGSYTGLRVGSSTAKGLCFGAGIPLISVSTPDIIVQKALAGGLVPDGCTAIVPMIDARRMEVYSAVYSPSGERLTEIAPVVVEGPSAFDTLTWREDLKGKREGLPFDAGGKILLVGDGALKCREVLADPDYVFVELVADAASMAPLAFKKLEAREFENTAYFEPFYLKDFVATVSRKKLW